MEIPEYISEYFLFFIKSLREKEVLHMHGQFVPLEEKDESVLRYLRKEFDDQKIAYPSIELVFDEQAAYWAAEFVYNCAQLLLNREDVISEVSQNFKPFAHKNNRSTILSADLCLRFIPDILEKLIEIDLEDPLIQVLKMIVEPWHYSTISICKTIEGLDFSMLEADRWMLQIYAERAAIFKNHILMKVPIIDQYYKEELGAYKTEILN